VPKRWISQFIVLTAWLLIALALGLGFGNLAWWLFGMLALYVGNLLRHVYRLDRALETGKPVRAFDTRGLWAESYSIVNKNQTKLRNRKKKYQRLLREVRQSTDALADAGIILNADFEIQWFNTAAKRLLGLDPTRDKGQRIDSFLRSPDFVRYLDSAAGEPVSIQSPHDDQKQLSVQIMPYGVQQSMAVVRDVTQQSNLDRMRRDFVANASHELRSPITVISGYLDSLAEDGALSATWATPIGEMQSQVARMTRILQDLLELSRMDTAGDEAEYEFVNVVDLLNSIRREYDERDDVPALTVTLSSDIALAGSEDELYSIFNNLIGNAVRFTPSDGSVVISWGVEGSRAVFSVEDSGVGIPDEHISRVTERFYRVDPGRSRQMGGTGLGLAIVKHAVQRHNGTLTIQSQLGEGSTFTCRFPDNRILSRRGTAQAVL
jgi:two-component system, OmpR family, phosphate regulon sensor histidine kinase PhoR